MYFLVFQIFIMFYWFQQKYTLRSNPCDHNHCESLLNNPWNGTHPCTETDSFTYLGSTINKRGGTIEDFKARIQKARVAFIMLRKIWTAKQIKTNTKLRIFNSNVKAVLLYGSETWRSTQKTLKKNTDLHQQMPA